MTKGQRRELWVGLFFASPYIVGFLGLALGPLVASFAFSFTNYDIFTTPKWIGLENFAELGQDKLFWIAIWNTAFYTVFSVPLGMTVRERYDE